MTVTMRNSDLPPILERMRESRGWSARELARRCNRSTTWYTRKEAGERVVSFDDLDDIAKATGHTVRLQIQSADEATALLAQQGSRC